MEKYNNNVASVSFLVVYNIKWMVLFGLQTDTSSDNIIEWIEDQVIVRWRNGCK